MLLSFISLILDSGVIPPGNGAYLYFTAVQNGLTSALTMCLLINGFVGFQLYEDGTTLSVWLLRGASITMFVITFLVSLATFKGWAGLSPTKTIGLFVVLYLVSGLELLIYVVMQVILVVNTLQDRWPLGDIAFGVFFFAIGQVILYAFSTTICNAVQHYLDGLFFATTCNLLGVMMIYKVCSTPNVSFWTIDFNDCYSIGTPSQEKILNSLSALSKATGKWRNFFQKTSVETLFIKIPSTPAPCTTPRLNQVEILTMEVSMGTKVNWGSYLVMREGKAVLNWGHRIGNNA